MRGVTSTDTWSEDPGDGGGDSPSLRRVSDRRVTARDIDSLLLDRTIPHWEPVFARARWLLAGIFTDVRTGNTAGSALLFNMEKLFETVLGLRIWHACQMHAGGRLSVGLQGPVTNLATSAFQLRPDITIRAEMRASPSSMQNGSGSISATRTWAFRAATRIR